MAHPAGVYALHRLVLAQCPFFETALKGGWREGEDTADGADRAPIELHFDANCSRAAFELCLARLYGSSRPTLVPPPWATAERWQRYAPFGDDADVEADAAIWRSFTTGEAQPATPSFLLSLVATATYLDLPALQKTALALIKETMSPFSVGTYLRFAIGEGLADPLIERDLPCAGLDAVGKPWLGAATPQSPASGGLLWYGEAADRIGQTAACWLARWAAEVLPYEEAQSLAPPVTDLVADDLRQLFERMPSARPPPIAIWSLSERGGLTDRWVRALIGSDGLYLEPTRGGRDDGSETDAAVGTSSELQRYDLAKRVVELRRRQRVALDEGADEPVGVDEDEYAAIFAEAVFFSHLVRPILPREHADRSELRRAAQAGDRHLAVDKAAVRLCVRHPSRALAVHRAVEQSADGAIAAHHQHALRRRHAAVLVSAVGVRFGRTQLVVSVLGARGPRPDGHAAALEHVGDGAAAGRGAAVLARAGRCDAAAQRCGRGRGVRLFGRGGRTGRSAQVVVRRAAAEELAAAGPR